MTFFAWLDQQVGRQDDIGAFARYAVKDRIFPRNGSRLNLFLARYEGMPERRNAVKLAHREWRRVRSAA